jgi:hypothetical protein
MSVAEWIEWWTSLTPEERRAEIERARIRKAYWRHRRAQVLFGILEGDALFGALEHMDMIAQPREDGR